MNTTGMTTMEIKKINKSKGYHLIYESRTISKQGIAAALQMGMNTVTQNLKLLEEEGPVSYTHLIKQPVNGTQRTQIFAERPVYHNGQEHHCSQDCRLPGKQKTDGPSQVFI